MVPASDWVTSKVRNTAGRVLDFDGTNDHLNFGNVLNFERTNSFTISAWVRVLSFPTFGVITTKMDSANQRGYFFGYNANRTLAFILRSVASGNRIFVNTTATTLALNTWGHVVVTYDGSSSASGVRFYFDGIVRASTTTENTLTGTIITSQALTVGARPAIPDGFANAQIAEIAIWNRAITAGEKRTLYRIGPGWFGKRESRFPGYAEQAAATGFKAYWANRRSQLIGGGL
jgi:hypothetical protein